jgi:hypothetical protein
VDEGNNWINVSWGPLSQTNAALLGTDGDYGGQGPLANYVLAATSPAIDYVPTVDVLPTGVTVPGTAFDFFGHVRPDGSGCNSDIGAVELQNPGSCGAANVSPTSYNFGTVGQGATSASLTLTLSNTGNRTLTGINVVFSGPFSRVTPGANNNCTATLAAHVICTITVVFKPVAGGAVTGTVTITDNDVPVILVAGSPVQLSGTGVASAASATLTPTTFAYPVTTRNCPTPVLGCLLDPTHTFVLRNTGNVTLTGITPAVLGGTNLTEYGIVPLVTTCGTAATTLAPNATCNIVVQFKPLTALPAGLKPATVSVTAGAAGVQSSTLTGTAN